jgi:hypothetical protein
LFESVVFGRTKNFELQYLNPLILYRVVEQKLDSPDNVLLGIDASLRLKNNTLLYGQLVVDELRINELFKRSGWWANKFGYQFGLKRIDIFNIDHLDILIEYNSVRPYTYSHRRTLDSEEFVVGSYSHYNQELAHPLGANFREAIMLLGYRVDKRWSIYGKLMWAETGKSTLQNFGENILVANDTRVREYDNTIGQGDKTKILQASTVLTYNLIQNYNIDLQFLFRNQTSQSGNNDLKSIYFALSFRANMSNQKLDY